MALLGELGSVNAVLKSATGLLREFKRPRLKSDDFAELLAVQLQQQPAAGAAAPGAATRPETVAEKAQRLSAHFMQLHDADRSGALNLEESGLDADSFAQVDLDANGQLDQTELQVTATARILAQYQSQEG